MSSVSVHNIQLFKALFTGRKDAFAIRWQKIFMENPSDNFSRIVHDYSDAKKGFITWKSLLEERLT